MKPTKSKTKASLLAIIMLLSLVTMLFAFTAVDAAVSTYNSYIYVSASPKVVGVGQTILLVAWTADIPPDIGETAGTVASPTGRAGWYGMQINLTKPNGESVLLDMPYSDPVGANYIQYTPETVGTYTIQAKFPDTWKNTTANQAHYLAAVSATDSFTVQDEPIQPWVETPLPNSYWTRPINSANRDWYVLAGNWLAGPSGGGGASINTPFLRPQGTYGGVPQQLVSCYGPTSAHILWTKPYYMGGLMDANYESIGYQTAHYQGLGWSGNIILQGKIYYAPRVTPHTTGGYVVVDLYTGQTLYETNNTKPAFGQIYNYESPNQHGGFAYLWRTSGQTVANPGGVNGTVWTAIDPMTGQTVYQIANVSATGTQVYGKDGSICYYNLVNYGNTTNPDYHLTIWNSSAIPSLLLGDSGTNYWQWRPATGGRGTLLGGIYVHDGSKGFSVNVSIPSPYNPRNPILNETGTIRAIRESEYMIIGTAGRNDERGDVQGMLIGVSLKPDSTLGKELWRTYFSQVYLPTSANASNTLIEVFPDQNTFICGNVLMQGGSKTLMYYAYDLTTGKLKWQAGPLPQFEYYNSRLDSYKGMLFLDQGYGGVLMAYNLTTGESIWNYTAKGIGFESPYGNYPMGIAAIADGNGLIYTGASEHSPTQPLWRGPNLRCINATDGTEVWSVLFWGNNMGPVDPSNMALSDGILVGLNYFDNEIYAFGKGPSATTVSGPLSGAVVNSPVTIVGTVTDQTETGRRTATGNDAFQFTLKGTPAISDADMARWMEYLFMQQSYPADAKGVPVHLATIDPNGNYFDIGTVTSDINGNYGIPFTPDIPGTYQILATFAGSNAYGPSTASTYITVADVPKVTQAPTTPQPTSMVETYFIPAIVGLFIFVAIMSVVTILLTRKRP
ncbi:MAG: PQQ-binding-like beta-propeller repeat protein [Candidatus Bathyarchaeota archaeon]|nr:PQQ-binding-like beta-propeller repeat protein [Candidatus Bathyarchaeota archaeon]